MSLEKVVHFAQIDSRDHVIIYTYIRTDLCNIRPLCRYVVTRKRVEQKKNSSFEKNKKKKQTIVFGI